MPDREKVIHAVEMAFELWIDEYTGCSWFKEDEVRQAKEDAISLLKEQEAVKPILIREGWNKHHNNYVCPRCDYDVFYEQNYCTECGVQFLWEGW